MHSSTAFFSVASPKAAIKSSHCYILKPRSRRGTSKNSAPCAPHKKSFIAMGASGMKSEKFLCAFKPQCDLKGWIKRVQKLRNLRRNLSKTDWRNVTRTALLTTSRLSLGTSRNRKRTRPVPMAKSRRGSFNLRRRPASFSNVPSEHDKRSVCTSQLWIFLLTLILF